MSNTAAIPSRSTRRTIPGSLPVNSSLEQSRAKKMKKGRQTAGRKTASERRNCMWTRASDGSEETIVNA